MAEETKTISVAIGKKTYEAQVPKNFTDAQINEIVEQKFGSMPVEDVVPPSKQDPIPSGREMMDMVASMNPVPQREPDRLSGSRMGAIATGGMAGAIKGGAIAGPPGAVLGGGAGAFTGSLMYDAATDAQKNLLKVEALQNYQIPDRYQRMRNAYNEGLFDIGFGVTGQALRPLGGLLGDVFMNYGLGVGRAEKDLARAARLESGVKLGIPEISRYDFVRGAPNILGRFPIISESFKKAQVDRFDAITKLKDGLFSRIGPTVNLAKQGVDMSNLAKKNFKQFRDRANLFYGLVKEAARKNNSKFDVTDLRSLARQTLATANEKLPVKYGFKEVTEPASAIAGLSSVKSPAFGPTVKRAKVLEKSRSGQQDPARDFNALVKDMAKLNTSQSLDALDGLAGRLDSIIEAGKKASNNEFLTPALALKEGIENALRTGGDAEVGKAFKAADQFFANGMKRFETATAQKFGRVDRKMFKVGYEQPGSLEADQIYNAVMDSKSPLSVKNLRKVFGKEAQPIFEAVQRRKIDDALQAGMSNIEKTGFNKKAFLDSLGITNLNSETAKTTREIFRGGGTKKDIRSGRTNLQDIRKFADLAEIALQQGVPDVSTFVARRAMLGGFKSVLRAFVPIAGATAVSGIGPGLAFTAYYLSRKGADALASPKVFRSLQQVIKYQNQPQLLRGAMLRVISQTPDAVSPEERPSDAPPPDRGVAPPIAR